MEHYGGPVTAELEAAREQYDFMSPETVEQLRLETEAEIHNRAAAALAGMTLMDAALEPGQQARHQARHQVLGRLDEKFRTHLDSHLDRETDPDSYDRMLELLHSTSVENMSVEQWYLGDRDANGNHDRLETSGKSRVASFYEDLCNQEAGGLPTQAEAQEAYDNAIAEVENYRHSLAQLSVQRRLLIRQNSRKAQDLNSQYQAVEADYKQAYLNAAQAATVLLRAAGNSDEDIRQSYIIGTIEERRAFTQAEADYLDIDDSRRSKVARWLADRENLLFFNAASGLALGFAAGKLVKGAAAVALAPAAPVALGIGAAVKSTRAVLNASVANRVSQFRLHDQRATEDLDNLSQTLQNQAAINDVNQLADKSTGQIFGSINERIESDRKSNRNRVVMAAAVSGAAAVAGAALADYIGERPKLFGNIDLGGEDPSDTGPDVAEPTNPPASPTDQLPTPEVAGFEPDVVIESGHGFTHELQDLASQRGLSLSAYESYELYQFLESQHQGNLFLNSEAYQMANGDWGIASSGAATWRPEVLRDIDQWLRTSGR